MRSILRELIAIRRELQEIKKLIRSSLSLETDIDGQEITKAAMEHVIRTGTIKIAELKHISNSNDIISDSTNC